MPEAAFLICIKDSVFIEPASGTGSRLTEPDIVGLIKEKDRRMDERKDRRGRKAGAPDEG